MKYGGSNYMVELNEFIAEALTSIVSGIMKAQQNEATGDYIAPLITGEKRNDYGNFHLKNNQDSQATIVQFDVEVTSELAAKSSGEGGGDFKLWVVNMKAKGSGEVSGKHAGTQKLQFAIPLKIPQKSILDQNKERL